MTVIAVLLALTLTPRETTVMRHLMTTRTFEYPHVGITGTRSEGYLALRVLARSKNADAAFKELVAHAAPAGQLYGLMGVSRTDPAFFRAQLERYRKLSSVTSVANGCEIMSEQLASIAYYESALQLPPGMTLNRWLTENPRKPSRIDIAGGGLTSLFLDAEEPAVAEQDALRDEKAAFP
jgi:hypothetical protein